MARICGWCKGHMGHTEGEGVTHGICPDCEREHFPDFYAAKREEEAMRRGAAATAIPQLLGSPLRMVLS